MLLSTRRSAGQNRDIRISNRLFDNVTIQIFRNDSNKSELDEEKIKGRQNSDNACYHSFQNPMSSRLLSKT
jgi:hypothetical protein